MNAHPQIGRQLAVQDFLAMLTDTTTKSDVSVHLGDHVVSALPPTCYYIPNFVSSAEEASILSSINSQPPSRWTVLTHRRLLSIPSQLTGTKRDTLLSSPLPTFLNEPILPRFEQQGFFRGSPHGAPNHCLVNEYAPGQGIMPHEDGPTYWPVTATVSLGGWTVLDIYEKGQRRASVETDGTAEEGREERHGQTAVAVDTARPKWRVLQEPRSLLVTSGDMYSCTLHGIADVEADDDLGEQTVANWNLLGDASALEDDGCKKSGKKKDRGLRISLTYRDVLKVSKAGGALRFMNKR